MMIDNLIRYITPLFIFKKNFTNKTIRIMSEITPYLGDHVIRLFH